MNKEIRIEEYKYLQGEHQKNRSYIFERPVLIIGIVTFAAQFLIQYQSPANVSANLSEHGQGILALPIMKPIMVLALIFILIFNLAFISERIKSDARIVAYIQLFHEGALVPYWVGWETSLRYHRRWMNKYSKNLKEKLKDKVDINSVYHIGWFYPKIYLFHAIFIIGLLYIFLIWCIEIYYINQYSVSFLFLIGLCITIYFIWSNPWNPWHNSHHSNLVEVQRAIWFDVFEDCVKKERFVQLKESIDGYYPGEIKTLTPS